MTQQRPPISGAPGPGLTLTDYPPLAGNIDVWRCELLAAREEIAEHERALSEAERARASRFGTSELRERYITGRGSLRRVLARLLDCTPASVPIVRGPRGRPRLEPDGLPDFNVTHTEDLAVFAIGVGLHSNARIGVDVESTRRVPSVERLARKLLTEEERDALLPFGADAARLRFLRTWTCKEAMSKATADGLRAPFGRIAVEPGDAPRVLAGPAPYAPDGWTLHRVPVAHGYIVTVALWRR